MWWLMMSLSVIVGVAKSVEIEVDLEPRASCEEARLRCAYRSGCGKALNQYLVGCSSVLQGPYMNYCPEHCQHSLIALTSTEEGKDLMNCKCSDDYCEDAKQRVEVCRPQVMVANRIDTVVSCSVAQFICVADAECSTALDYYNRFCRSMFQGKRCTHRCLNSINILRRQEKAAKLKTCKCDGRENFDCKRIQHNMAKLCYHQKEDNTTTDAPVEEENNVIIKENENETHRSGCSSNFAGNLLIALTIIYHLIS